MPYAFVPLGQPSDDTMLCGNISQAPSSWGFPTAQVNLHVRIMVILCHMEALNKTLTTLAAQRNRFVGMACAETMPVQYTNCLHTWWCNVVQYVFFKARAKIHFLVFFGGNPRRLTPTGATIVLIACLSIVMAEANVPKHAMSSQVLHA